MICTLVLGATACGPARQTRDSQPTAPAEGARSFVGHWVRDLPGGGRYLLSIFPSGVVGFQHIGPDLPISRSYGRWTASGDVLAFTIVGDEPDGRRFPLAKALTVSVESGTLTLVANGERTAWSAHDTYGVSREGWQEREANGERNWTYSVEQAEKKPLPR